MSDDRKWVDLIEIRREDSRCSLKLDGVEFPYYITGLVINSVDNNTLPSITLTLKANSLEVHNSVSTK